MSAGLVIRADGGPGIGAGHVGRCLALAQAWRDEGGEVTLVSDHLPVDWAQRFAIEGVAVEQPHSANLSYADAEWVAIDGYRFDVDEQRSARAAGARVLVIDDHGSTRTYVADVVLDQNPGARESAYNDRAPDTELLLGPQYSLLRREFRTRTPDPMMPEKAHRVLVSVGGFGTSDVRELVDEAVDQAGLEPLALDGTADVPSLMAAADMAVAAAGSTALELCFMGVPAVLLSTAPNQRPVAAGLAGLGAAHDAGPREHVTPGALASRLRSLASDSAERRQLSVQGRALVDGMGAVRVAARLRSK